MSWKGVTASIPQSLRFGPVFFKIYISDLSEGLKSEVARDTYLFFNAKDINLSQNKKIAEIINPDFSKQAEEVIFKNSANCYICDKSK